MKKIVLFLLLLCSLTLEAQAASSKVTALPAGSVLEADFIQQRHLNGIPKAIESKGHLVLWDGKGLVWSTSSPFPNTILISKSGLYQLENKVKTPLVKAGGNSAMFDVMAGIFNMKEGVDVKGFTIENLPFGNRHWRLQLTPQYPQVQNFIKSITVEGDVQIAHITILRPNGDRDEIDIKGHVITEVISQQVKELFDE